ncbi:MAG: hypothetical protein FWC41_01400, partial [Firmicutes bacterium]|nr:hypothetical protein [Bacillota bacterium]
VTHTFVNGVLRITQKGTPNEAKCICHTDVSYTINGISRNEVNVIFINGEQVYCHNDNQIENLLVGKWRASNYQAGRSDVIVFTENLRVQQYFDYILAGQPNTTMYPAPYVTYLLSGDEITFTVHWFYPNAENSSETFKYVLNGNSLIIKGFTNPFSDTKEMRGDVHFTRIEENGNQSKCGQDVIIPEYDDAPRFPVSIIDLKIEGNCLKIKFGASGCDIKNVKLIAHLIRGGGNPYWSLSLSFDEPGLCARWITEEMSFNIEKLQIQGKNSITLNISENSILYEY